jgi:hypothetical protein
MEKDGDDEDTWPPKNLVGAFWQEAKFKSQYQKLTRSVYDAESKGGELNKCFFFVTGLTICLSRVSNIPPVAQVVENGFYTGIHVQFAGFHMHIGTNRRLIG